MAASILNAKDQRLVERVILLLLQSQFDKSTMIEGTGCSKLDGDLASGLLQVAKFVTQCFFCRHGKSVRSEAGSDARTTHQSQFRYWS